MRNWEENVRRVDPYVPGEQPKDGVYIKLNTNENPYPPSPGVEAAIRSLDTETLRRYPDPASAELVNALAARYGRLPEEIFPGVGSDDVLAMAFLTFFSRQEKPVLFADVTYSFYEVWAQLFNVRYETVPLDDAFRIRPEDYKKENGGIVVANPNAPTGRALPLTELEEIVASNPESVVIVDEAYVDFGAESAVGLIPKYENLLVVQTFSKSRSLAGLRIGFALGNEKLIRYMNDVKYSYNSYTMNRLQIAAGTAALADDAYFRDKCRKIMATRDYAEKEFASRGFRFFPSAANFLFVTHPERPAKELYEMLRAKKILVRYFNKPRISEYLRVTIGTEEEMKALFAALD